MKSRDERNEDGSDQERKYFYLYVFLFKQIPYEF